MACLCRDQNLDLGRVRGGDRRAGGGSRLNGAFATWEGSSDRQTEDWPVRGHGRERQVPVRDELRGELGLYRRTRCRYS